jgi:hypothetical protein
MQYDKSEKTGRVTRAFEAFQANLRRVGQVSEILDFGFAPVEAKRDELLKSAKQLSKEDRRAEGKRIGEEFGRLVRRHHSVIEWVPVMLVTFTEAYLQDTLAYLARFDRSLMENSNIHAKYADVLSSQTIDDLAAELRTNWARKFVDDGGPSKWLDRLQRMGAVNYQDDLDEKMEFLWGVRHVVVHAAGLATHDFVRRHPEVAASVGKRVKINAYTNSRWIDLVRDFVTVTDAFVVARGQAQRNSD